MQPQLAKAAVDTEVLIKKVSSGTLLCPQGYLFKIPKQSNPRHILGFIPTDRPTDRDPPTHIR